MKRALPLLSLSVTLLLGCDTSTGGGGGAGGEAGVPGASSGGASGARGTGGSGAVGNGGAGAASPTGGAPATGGSGAAGSGGAHAMGGGGAAGTGSGGAHAMGGGGAAGTGSGCKGGTAGTAGRCKRGIASNTAPGAAFFPAVTWWYNWSLKPSGANTGIEFAPMVWGASTLSSAIPAGSKFLLGFNEPNFMSQSNLTPAQAAADWPALQANARNAGAPIVGPAMNYCGPAASCNGTDPYQYLTTFFAACTGCEVDYVAAHWYNCDLPSLQDYLESGGNLPGYEQFGKPIWLTEFSCDTTATEAQQEAYMRAAIPYLESNPHVFRYSWFSASPIPNAQLVNSDGSPTALGQVYISLPQSCP
jgi:hypothetical protein